MVGSIPIKFCVTAKDFFTNNVFPPFHKPFVVFDGIDSDSKEQTKHDRI